ncbi:hypothetical protein MM182_12110 [Aeromonas sp. MR19]|uniref:hypothetical protein n=1 Tax=Aeromonas sp. MR19 TaxID=2923421 RepID=UPI001F4A3991|nr:hypothetical protein [Aeromonas sp. MR19]MCH7376115.1 hypothetical protein [Aeromonas sp. MR19]
MATEPTPEQSAREIVSIFIDHFDLGPGSTLRINNFNILWPARRFQHNDFNTGMVYAMAQRWIVANGDRTSFELTQAGFDTF